MRVKVVVRLRPTLAHEEDNNTSTKLKVTHTTPQQPDQKQQPTTVVHLNNHTYQVDQVADHTDDQAAFYQKAGVENLVDAVVAGYHGTVFAYGQTGSGKTYTMEGYHYAKTARGPAVDVDATPDHRHGLVSRAVRGLFDGLRRKHDDAPRVRVLCSFVQVYRERVLDLLNPSAAATTWGLSGGGAPRGLKVRWTASRDFHVENLFVEEAESPAHALALFESGVRHKVVAETKMNAASSRSHCLFTLTVQQYKGAVGAGEPVSESRLTLVDLAGSERQNALDEATRASIQDSVEINKSLFTLRKVILSLSGTSESSARAAPPAHVPYRDSTLTKLLKHSLGGNCRTLMIACISPLDAHADENASTLAYAARARAITNKPVVNLDPHSMAMRSLLEENAQLKSEIARLQHFIAMGGGGGRGAPRVGNPYKERAAADGDGQVAPGADAALQRELEAARVRGSQAGAGLAQGVELAKQLATANGRLREACDGLGAQRDELQELNATLMEENGKLRERVSLAELALAMESFTSAISLPGSVVAQVEEQLRTAALSLMQLRAENEQLRDQLAAAPPTPLLRADPPTRRDAPPRRSAPPLPKRRPSRGDIASPAFPKRRGSADATATPNAAGSGATRTAAAATDAPKRASGILTSTGRLNLTQLAADLPPPAAAKAAGAATAASCGRAGGAATMTAAPPSSTFTELDELSALLRKKSELKARRAL